MALRKLNSLLPPLRGNILCPKHRAAVGLLSICRGASTRTVVDEKSEIRYENMYDRLLEIYRDSEPGASASVSVNRFVEDLKLTGLREDDPRLQPTFEKLQKDEEGSLPDGKFFEAVSTNMPLIEKALKRKMAIPDFSNFTKEIEKIYQDCVPIREGETASYIPELSRVDPELWGVSLCTVDGQRHSVGDSTYNFTLQSGNKCFSYALAVDAYGSQKVHKYIGKEPSGQSFNSLFLNSEFKPHNPMINAGALVLSSLIKPTSSITERTDQMLQQFCDLAGLPHRTIKCDMMTYDSEMETAYRNYALMYYMKGMKVFEDNVDIEETIKFYTKLCAIEIHCEQGAVMAATLANAGVCPTTGKKVLGMNAVRDALTLMHSCGMYDSAGKFSFSVGLPAKSGVSGVILVVVPNVMGMCLFSPRVNKNGNSLRGLHFCNHLVETFNFHNYDSLVSRGDKIDPRRKKNGHKELEITSIMYAAHAGALSTMERYWMLGMDLKQCNYDGRTPLHVAAAEGHYDVVDMLLKKARVPVNVVDRWSKTALDEAIYFGHDRVKQLLEDNGAVTSSPCNNDSTTKQ